MATPQMRVQSGQVKKLEAVRRPAGLQRQPGLRLLGAERSEEIYAVLLEEIVALGFRRAMIALVDFESGELVPVAALNCSRKYQQRFRASLYAAEDPVIATLHIGRPSVLPGLGSGHAPLYCHPIVYRNRSLCWEAERERRADCLAVENFRKRRRLRLQEQVCATCQMRAYAGVVLVDLRSSTSESDIADLRALIEVANRYLARIFKTEHLFNRMSDMLRDLTSVRRVQQLKLERRMMEIEKFAATGRLAGSIAHEINNPMEAIKNAIFLLSDKMQPDAKPIYQILKGETERVARIVRQMLGLYRTAGQVGPVEVNPIVEDTLLLFSRQLERNGIRVEADLGKLPLALGSADQIRQVLSNLVVNASDSMPKGGVLKIRTRHRPAHGIHGHISILVADSGAGIPPDLLASVFEPFVSTKGEKGTGLGLWIVKGIVENHGGKIRVRSTVGRGTLFKLDLPVVR